MKKIFILIFAAILGGCTTTSPYRTESGSICGYIKTGDCHNQSMTVGNSKKSGEYLLSFYEYDEQGMLHDPNARKKIVEKYRNIASHNEVLLITFFHGWHHNAKGKDDENSDIVEFRKVLEKAAKTHPEKKVLGVYVGWRGRSLAGVLDYLTFWGRKHTAHEIGQLGGITEALLELESVVEKSNNLESRMVTIGHSFGGAALYSTIGHVLSERYASSRDSNGNGFVKGFGDLVVLLNPAFEAMRYTALFELAQTDCAKFSNKQPPRLVALSSEADYAVGLTFQAGQFFNAISEEHRNTVATHCVGGKKEEYELRQFIADINGVGHYPPFITHDLAAEKKAKSFSNQHERVNMKEAWRKGVSLGEIPFSNTTLTSRNIAMPHNPYMNIYTDENVMDGHNDIWTDEVLEFLNDIITVSTF